jgi:capsular polysaccharide biosynthesis protein
MNLTYQNVLATPFTMEGPWKRNFFFGLERKMPDFPHCRKLLKGALYDKNGHIIHESIRKGGIAGDQVISISPIFIDPNMNVGELIEGRSAYLGNLYSHYGHFVTEGLSRFSEFRELNNYDQILFHPFIFDYPNSQLTEYHHFFFDQMGIDCSKIKLLKKPSRIEHVKVFQQLWTINDTVDPTLQQLYRYLSNIPPCQSIQREKFFCSRKQADRIHNIREVEEVFLTLGFEVLYLEDLMVEKQMSIFKGKNLIVGCSGSSMHNILFGRQNTRFVEIGDSRTPNNPHVMQQLASSISVSKYQFVPFQSKDGNFWDLERLLETFEEFET